MPVSEKQLIRDERPLLPDYAPENVLHREAELRDLADALKPAAEGRKPQNVFAFGPPGTGKTTCAKHVLTELTESSDRVCVAIANCWQNNSRQAILSRLGEAAGMPLPRRGVATDEVIKRVAEMLKADKKTAIVLLDEFDALFPRGEEKVLYDLSRANEQYGVNIGVIAITNDAGLLARADGRIRSSFGGRQLEFKQYSPVELKDILHERAKKALAPGAYEDEALALCAAHGAKAGGDARVAIESLLAAARIAERRGAQKLEESDAAVAVKQSAVSKPVSPSFEPVFKTAAQLHKARESLSEAEKRAMEILEKPENANGITSGDLYAELERSGIKERTARNYIESLEKRGLIKTEAVQGTPGAPGAGRTRRIRPA
ncbi:AAA family ATPase [Candidatus Micrarchaeota archaeon]|nr:AAA family ATPase [Candidatus Micrarchaeota archaeon]